jgi:hypothetical protein
LDFHGWSPFSSPETETAMSENGPTDPEELWVQLVEQLSRASAAINRLLASDFTTGNVELPRTFRELDFAAAEFSDTAGAAIRVRSELLDAVASAPKPKPGKILGNCSPGTEVTLRAVVVDPSGEDAVIRWIDRNCRSVSFVPGVLSTEANSD